MSLLCKVIKAFQQHRQLTVSEVAKVCELTARQARYYVQCLRDSDTKIIHISEWRVTKSNMYFPVYSYGEGENVAPPPRATKLSECFHKGSEAPKARQIPRDVIKAFRDPRCRVCMFEGVLYENPDYGITRPVKLGKRPGSSVLEMMI